MSDENPMFLDCPFDAIGLPTPAKAGVREERAEGKSVREIGKELYLSEATVRNHVRSLLLALDAHSQLDALAKAREAGLL